MASKNHLGVSTSRKSSRQKGKQLNHSESIETEGNNKRELLKEEEAKSTDRIGSGVIILGSIPTVYEWNKIVAATKSGIALTGTLAERPARSPIGLVDIGTSDNAYLFCIALPGVSCNAGDFSCEIETNGRVLVKGITVTGQKKVYAHSQIFKMKTQNLCPPGAFSISFKLPGPVDPRGFSGTFGNNGIFEGIVLKRGLLDLNKV